MGVLRDRRAEEDHGVAGGAAGDNQRGVPGVASRRGLESCRRGGGELGRRLDLVR